MAPSSRPYQSQALKWLLRKSNQLSEGYARSARQLTSAAVWGLQVVLYPVYALFQTGRMTRQQMYAAGRPQSWLGRLFQADPKTPPAPAPQVDPVSTADQPIQQILQRVHKWVAAIQQATLAGTFPVGLLPDALLPNAEAGTLVRQQGSPVQGIVSLVESRSLALVMPNQALWELPTAELQRDLRKAIAWYVANYHYERKQQSLQQRAKQAILALPPVNLHAIWPIQVFQQTMQWMQSSPVARTTNLFREADLIAYLQRHQHRFQSQHRPSKPALSESAAAASQRLAAALPASPIPTVSWATLTGWFVTALQATGLGQGSANQTVTDDANAIAPSTATLDTPLQPQPNLGLALPTHPVLAVQKALPAAVHVAQSLIRPETYVPLSALAGRVVTAVRSIGSGTSETAESAPKDRSTRSMFRRLIRLTSPQAHPPILPPAFHQPALPTASESAVSPQLSWPAVTNQLVDLVKSTGLALVTQLENSADTDRVVPTEIPSRIVPPITSLPKQLKAAQAVVAATAQQLVAPQPPAEQSPVHAADWIEAEVTVMDYIEHPLETVLRWLDAALAWLEGKLKWLWIKLRGIR